MRTPQNHDEIGARLRDTAGITCALKAAAEEARQAHIRAGVPCVTWRDGHVVYLDPVTLQEVPEDSSSTPNQA